MLRKLFMLPVLAVGALMLPATSAKAQQYFDAGTFELTLTGSGTSNEDVDAGGFQVQGSLGYFVIDQLELGVRQGFGYQDNDDITGGGTSVTASTAVFVDYHFDLDRFQPFIGAGIGYSYGDADVDETFFAGPEAGIKYFVKDDTFIYGLIQYQFFFDEAETFDDQANDGSFLYAVGIGFTW